VFPRFYFSYYRHFFFFFLFLCYSFLLFLPFSPLSVDPQFPLLAPSSFLYSVPDCWYLENSLVGWSLSSLLLLILYGFCTPIWNFFPYWVAGCRSTTHGLFFFLVVSSHEDPRLSLNHYVLPVPKTFNSFMDFQVLGEPLNGIIFPIPRLPHSLSAADPGPYFQPWSDLLLLARDVRLSSLFFGTILFPSRHRRHFCFCFGISLCPHLFFPSRPFSVLSPSFAANWTVTISSCTSTSLNLGQSSWKSPLAYEHYPAPSSWPS